MTGIILCRAQPFHNGHLAQIKRAYQEMKALGNDLYVIVGSADKSGTKRNPIPIVDRLDMINASLADEFSEEDLEHIHVKGLRDLSDEANNTHSWGDYLYDNICKITRDREFVFYYSDKPEIILSWFNNDILQCIWFRFLPRVGSISATFVRNLICDAEFETCDEKDILMYVPYQVWRRAEWIQMYIQTAK
jgi:phosphopantetheine adenylyltransferase